MTDIERFWSNVEKTETCWLWKRFCINGYGRVQFRQRRCRAHRVAWELACGNIPAGLYVCHKCDNRQCVRPDHLFLGTQKDNIQDAKQKGRLHHLFGENSPKAVITEAIAHQIFAQYQPGIYGYKMLAKQFNVSRGLVKKLLTGKSWKHLKFDIVRVPASPSLGDAEGLYDTLHKQ